MGRCVVQGVAVAVEVEVEVEVEVLGLQVACRSASKVGGRGRWRRACMAGREKWQRRWRRRCRRRWYE